MAQKEDARIELNGNKQSIDEGGREEEEDGDDDDSSEFVLAEFETENPVILSWWYRLYLGVHMGIQLYLKLPAETAVDGSM